MLTEALERPVIRFKNLIWGDVDTQEDFKRLKYNIYRRFVEKKTHSTGRT